MEITDVLPIQALLYVSSYWTLPIMILMKNVLFKKKLPFLMAFLENIPPNVPFSNDIECCLEYDALVL